MKLVDLSREISPERGGVERRLMHITQQDGVEYDGVVYDFTHGGMIGTYIDYPGHIDDCDDGVTAANCDLKRLYRVDATVIHLGLQSGYGEVNAEMLQRAAPDPVRGSTLVLHALDSDDEAVMIKRDVWLAHDAIDWIVKNGFNLLVSDIYESAGLHGVFGALFRAGVWTVCMPVNMGRLDRPYAKLTVLPGKFAGVTQLTCRVVAEVDG